MHCLSPAIHETLNLNILDKLKNKHVYTVLDFIKTDSKIIEKASNLTFKEITDIRKCLLKKYCPPHRNAFAYYQSIVFNCSIIQTGITSLDALLEGGLYTGNIYEICGLPSSGKTLFCLTLLKNVISKSPDNIYYLDTKYDFHAGKLKQMISNLKKEDVATALSKVLVKRTITRRNFMNSLFDIKEKLHNDSKLKLIIIDSLPPLYQQTSDHVENNSFLNYTANILHYLATEYNIVIVITNLITLWNEGDFVNVDVMKEKLSCGNYWYNIPNVRLKFTKNYEKLKITLTKTIKIMPIVRECQVEILSSGIV